MLDKKHRLSKKKDFEPIYKKGRSFSWENLNLKYLKNGLNYSRFGFIVSQKVAKKAVKRNRLKRLLRESVRLMLKENKIKPGFDVIIIPYPKILENENLKRRQIDQKLEKIFKKINLYNAK